MTGADGSAGDGTDAPVASDADGSGDAGVTTGTGTTAAQREAADGRPADVPVWDDPYLEEVSRRLATNYDLEKEYAVRGESFDLYGHMELHSEKHFFHPALSFAHHESHEYLFVRRIDRATDRELDRLVELGHDLADDWIDADEEHYSTDFTFVLVAPDVPDAIRSRIAGLDERTLIKYGFHGHYQVNVVAVAPETSELVANDDADVEEAFRTWEPIEREEPGLLGLIARRLEL